MSNTNFSELASRDRIIRVAALLFAERGYHAVGVNDLCKAVGLSRGALYHHIHSKEEILDEICSSYMTQLGEVARHTVEQEPDPEIQLRKLGHDLIGIIARHKAELTVCFREIQSLSGERREKVLGLHATYERIWADVLKAGAKTGQFRTYSKSRLKGLLGMYYYSYIWIQPENASMIDDITDTFHDVVLKAVLSISEPLEAKRENTRTSK
ncbi:MAG: TetR family transcriptional regulator [Burkholderiaceae bacterium]|nr:TetR family transcriptional regulator [Burkholderiaceae bacterium]